jgi:hypothetical protein
MTPSASTPATASSRCPSAAGHRLSRSMRSAHDLSPIAASSSCGESRRLGAAAVRLDSSLLEDFEGSICRHCSRRGRDRLIAWSKASGLPTFGRSRTADGRCFRQRPALANPTRRTHDLRHLPRGTILAIELIAGLCRFSEEGGRRRRPGSGDGRRASRSCPGRNPSTSRRPTEPSGQFGVRAPSVRFRTRVDRRRAGTTSSLPPAEPFFDYRDRFWAGRYGLARLDRGAWRIR